MTRREATKIAEDRFSRDYRFRLEVTPAIRQGYVERETARLLGEPVPQRRRRSAGTLLPDDLAGLLSRSLDTIKTQVQSRRR